MDINLDNILDRATRDNLEKLSIEFSKNPFLNGNFKHFEVAIGLPDSAYKFKHNLSFTPKDILITYISDNSSVEIMYDQIDGNFIVFNIPSACTIRFFAGLASKGQGV